LNRRRAVLFDAAGTLIELCEPVGETYSRIAREHGVAIAPGELDAAFRTTFKKVPAMVFPGVPIEQIPPLEKTWWRKVVTKTFLAAEPNVRFRDFEAFFEDLFEAMSRPDTWREISGARNLLLKLRSLGWATAIVSNFDRRLPALLRELGLAELFDVIVLCSDAGAAKPAPAIFHRALEQLEVPASRAVVVGDDEAQDIEGARAAGLRAIHVRSLATLDALLGLLPPLADPSGERRGGSQDGE
jgi:putative hydrolase of the HAD superfamily